MSRKKITIAVVSVIAVVLVAIAVTFIVALSKGDITVSSGTFIQSSTNFENGVWSEKKRKANGSSRIDHTFSADELINLRAESSNSSGEMTLTLTQGGIEKTLDISGSFSGNIDTNDFEPDSIALRLDYINAEYVDVVVRWDNQ